MNFALTGRPHRHIGISATKPDFVGPVSGIGANCIWLGKQSLSDNDARFLLTALPVLTLWRSR